MQTAHSCTADARRRRTRCVGSQPSRPVVDTRARRRPQNAFELGPLIVGLKALDQSVWEGTRMA